MLGAGLVSRWSSRMYVEAITLAYSLAAVLLSGLFFGTVLLRR
jgi:hypothetical protein